MVAYAVAWGMAGWFWNGPVNDLDAYFWPAVRIALSGHPLQIYMVRVQATIPNDNGPLGLVPLTGLAAALFRLGWMNEMRLRHMLVLAAFSIFSLLMTREAILAIDRLRGASLGGRSRLVAYGIFAVAPPLLISLLGYGHIEQPMTIWLVLLAVRVLAGGRTAVSGIGFGLAILTRTVAALPLIPLAVLLFTRGRMRALTVFLGSAAAVALVGVLPFALADPADTVYSLLTGRAGRSPSGGSVWELLAGTPYQSVAERADIVFVLGLAAILSLVVVHARQELTPASRDMYGLLALTAFTLPFLAKSVWPYYFLDAYVFGAVWWLAAPVGSLWGRRSIGVALPLLATMLAVVTDYEMGVSGGPIPVAPSVAISVLLALVIGALFVRLLRRSGPERARPNLVRAPPKPADANASEHDGIKDARQ